MAADINVLYVFLTSIWHQTTVFNITWIFNIVAVLVSTFIITHDKNTIPFLLLPLTILFHMLGLVPSIIWYIVTVLIFVVRSLSNGVGSDLMTINQKTKQYIGETQGWAGRRRREYETNRQAKELFYDVKKRGIFKNIVEGNIGKEYKNKDTGLMEKVGIKDMSWQTAKEGLGLQDMQTRINKEIEELKRQRRDRKYRKKNNKFF